MTEAERLDTFEHACRNRGYPEALTQALVQYLTGEGTLDKAHQVWQAVLGGGRFDEMGLLLSASEQHLDTLDLRTLDLDCVTERASYPWSLYSMAKQERVTAAFEYVLSRGIEQRQVLLWALSLVAFAVDAGQVTPIGQYVLSSLPEHADDLLNWVERREGHFIYQRRAAFVTLLLAAQPPSLDLAWQVAQQVQQEEIAGHHDDANTLGMIARALLKADPARFTPWVRGLAGPSSPVSNHTRFHALDALLHQDQEQHLDLAFEAARTPLPAQAKFAPAQLQITGLRALMACDPVTHWPVLEEAVTSPNDNLSSQALKVLARFSFDQARSTLQYCVARGYHGAPLTALELLLKQPWDGQETYVLSLLDHHSKHVRERTSRWLVAQDESMMNGIAPFLVHRRADVRLAAVQTLAQIGGEPTTSLLAARLAAEKARRVKEAILDAVGVPAARAAFQGTRASSPEAISVEAEATLRYLPRPALAWFDAREAPALCWTTGVPVPPAVLSYLLYRQSRVQRKDSLDAHVSQALALLDRRSAGNLALALYRGWASRGAASEESWLLPLVCTLADERLVLRLGRQVETWARGTRRALAARGVRALALIESEAALDELNALAKEFTHGKLKATIRQALAEALASGQPV